MTVLKKQRDDGDGNRSCTQVETGRSINSKRKHYPPPLYQAAHVHKLIPLQNATVQTINGCIWPIHSVLDLP